jgi:hypoxanthine phosphoribosyltransferase
VRSRYDGTNCKKTNSLKMITVLDKNFVPYLSADTIAARVAELGKELDAKYEGKNPLFLCILNGSFMFASDLYKHITTPSEISFVKLASYKGTTSTGTVINMIGLEKDLFDRHVVIVEDIVDTGKTLHQFLPTILHQQPASVSIATLLQKPEALQHKDLVVDHICFEIPNKFVVGYGLDYDGFARNLPEIYQLAE